MLFLLLAGNCLWLPAQRIFDPEYVARRIGMEEAFAPDSYAEFPAVVDSLEEVYQLDPTDDRWLELQWFRVIGLIEVAGFDSAGKVAEVVLGSVPAQKNQFATRALLAVQGFIFHRINFPQLGERGSEAVLRAIDMAHVAGDPQVEFDLAIFLAAAYIDFERRDLAWEWLDRAERVLPQINDAYNCYTYYVNAADASNPGWGENGARMEWETPELEEEAFVRVRKAIDCGEQAILGGEAEKSEVSLAYHIRADFWRTPGEEVFYLKKSLSCLWGQQPLIVGQTYARLAGAYLKTEDFDSARIYMDSCRVLKSAAKEYPIILEHMYVVFLRYYSKVGDQPDSLLKYQMLYYKSVAEAKKDGALVELELNKAKYKEAQSELVFLEQQNEIEGRKRRNRNLQVTLGTLGFIALLVLFFFLRLRQRNKVIQAKNTQIESMVKELEQNLEEKTALIHEVNHRVKNNLQMITAFVDLQTQNVALEETIRFSNGIRKRIRAVSLVHELIMDEKRLLGMDFREYALELIQELEAIFYKGDALECHSDFVPVKFGLSATMHMGILLNELVSNSMKHADQEGKGLEIWIQLERKGENLVLTYRDSGGGIPPEAFEKKGKTQSIGLLLVDAMARQLEGTLTYEQEGGGRYVFEFPTWGLED